MTIIKHVDISICEKKLKPLWWQIKGLQFTTSGYGKKIPTQWMIKLPESKQWRRVYVCIYSNIGTAYVQSGKDWIVIEGL